MKFLVLGIAVVLIAVSISIIIHPRMLKEMLHTFLQKQWLWPVSLTRILVGSLFVYVAPSSANATFLGIFGIVLIIAGVSVPLLGSHRIESIASFWLAQKDYMIRLFGFIVLLLGVSLALATV